MKPSHHPYIGQFNQFLQSKSLKIPSKNNCPTFTTQKHNLIHNTLSNRSQPQPSKKSELNKKVRHKLLLQKSQTIHEERRLVNPKMKKKSSIERVLSQTESLEIESTCKNKFKRFSKMLKQKYLFFSNNLSLSDVIKQHRIQKSVKKQEKNIQIDYDHIKRNTKKQSKPRNIPIGLERFSSNLKFKKRPSSGVPLKHKLQDRSQKRRLDSFSLSPHQSLELKHIEALCFRNDPQSTKSANCKPDAYRCSCIRNKIKTEPLEVHVEGLVPTMEECICIDPWQQDFQRYKNLYDIDISIKMPY